ncbi:MAG: hypothetical protein LLF90_09070 [Methanomicrobiaceae archaeon]|nr:hypothetical protein [Methanomicrobiaceae archaeon]
MLEEKEGGDLVIGGARNIGGRCIIPVIRALAIRQGEGAVISLVPVALLFAEGEDEYLTLLPGAPPGTGDAIGTLRDNIEREKEKCAG